MNDGFSTIPGSKIETRWTLVTPTMAEDMLKDNTENRTLRPKHVDRLVKDMREDRFLTTHQGIAFDERGKLIDGQHRLHAIRNSRIAQWVLVTIGLPDLSRRVVDGGAKRRAHDFMPGKFKQVRSSAIRYMLAIELTGNEFSVNTLYNTIQQVTPAAIQDAWDDWDDIEKLAARAHHASGNVHVCGPSSLLTGALLYPETAMEFLDGLDAMTGLDQGDPRLALLKFRGKSARISTPATFFLAAKSAKAFNHGKAINVLRFNNAERLKV